jgi:hypothetical protein
MNNSEYLNKLGSRLYKAIGMGIEQGALEKQEKTSKERNQDRKRIKNKKAGGGI